MRNAWAVVIVAVVLAGCAHSRPPLSTWLPPDRYAYTLQGSCGEQYLTGRIRLWVHGGAVVDAEGLDESGRRLADGPLDRLPTIATLLDLYNDAVRTGADKAVLTTEPTDGHPVRIDIDQDLNTTDDESCFAIDDYQPDAAPPPAQPGPAGS
jgi:hypothetical protein